jgi:hypoxanthine-guanine phosphoribosyltransferase
LAHQARFDGEIERGSLYLVVDDFVGQGGTLANLIGYIKSEGGVVIGATVLTGKPYSAMLEPSWGNLEALRSKHGKDLEDWWIQEFGFDFDCLTRSEAHYLERTADAHTVRSRLIEAGLKGSTQFPRAR